MAKKPAPWFVYIVRCRGGSLYTGITTDPVRRLMEHNRGRGGKYTASRRPVALVYREPEPDRSSALKREAALKSLSRRQKELLAQSPLTS